MEVDSENSKNISDKVHDKPPDIGAALESIIYHVGVMGTYQRFLFVAMLPFGVCWAFVYFSQMFITATPQEHWCRVPALDGLDAELRRSLSIPGANGPDYDHCNVFNANWTHVLETMTPPHLDTPVVPCPDGWEFLFEDIPYPTVVSEREWVCDRAYLVPLSQAINFIGSIAGGILCGIFADKFGRLPVLLMANLFGCVGGVATMFTTGFWDFSVCRFIVGMSSDSLFIMIYILAMEYVGIEHRTWVANLSIAFYFGSGSILLPWLALWISNWRYLLLATSLPMLLVLVAPFVLPESARWLVSKGRVDKAVQVLLRFEKINKTKIPQKVMDDFVFLAKTTKEPEENFLVFFKTPSLRTIMACLIIAYLSIAMVFDGLIRMSETLGLDFFLTFTVTSATEIPSNIIVVMLMDRFGRCKLTFAPIVCAGILSFVAAFVPRGLPSVALAVTARFFTNMSLSAVMQWAPELLPTVVRASGASFMRITAFAALAISPFIVFSEREWEGLPLVVVAVLAFVGGGVTLLLPETAGRPMPQTMEDWEKLAKTRPYQQKRKDVASSLPDATDTNS